MNFLRTFFASCLGALVAMVLLVVIGIALISAFAGEQVEVIGDQSVLHLKLDGPINELEQNNPLEGLPLPGAGESRVGLLQLLEAIEQAKDDDKISGIYLQVGFPQTLYGSLEEIRQALIDFKQSGKWIVAYNTIMSEGAYYLSSAADEVYLHPEGELEFNGLTAQFTSFKKLLDKLEIKPQVFRVGEYKSAVEPFISEKMSEENELQMQSMINSIYNVMLQRVSESRNVPVDTLRRIADNMLVRNAEGAVGAGLIDSLLYKDQFDQLIKKKLDLNDDEDIRFVSYGKYRKSYQSSALSSNEIAVIVAEGTILPGRSDNVSDPMVGAETFVKEIRRARESDRVKAIVLRVNSPGGEYRSSDMIWREVMLAAREKPVIASMGDLAASGGYYISMACDTIVAHPQTITGSIGIFMVMFDMSNFFDNKLGIQFEEVKTGQYGEVFTVTRPLNDAEKAFWQKNLDDNYLTFITKAAEGRSKSLEQIRSVAGGRVWTGVQASENGLADILGGFPQAVKIAAAKAGITDDYRLRYYPRQKSFVEMFIEQSQEDAKTQAMQKELGGFYILYDQWKGVSTYQGMQARLPFEFSLH